MFLEFYLALRLVIFSRVSVAVIAAIVAAAGTAALHRSAVSSVHVVTATAFVLARRLWFERPRKSPLLHHLMISSKRDGAAGLELDGSQDGHAR